MKKWLCLLFCAAMLCSLCGCSLTGDSLAELFKPAEVAEQEALAHLGFSKGELFNEDEEIAYFLAEEFADKTGAYSRYRGTIHYEALDENEKTLYHALEYAMENGYNNILVDDLLIDKTETLAFVLEFLALDSPLLEQNVRYEYGDFTSYYPVSVWGGLREVNATLDGYYLTVHSFEPDWWAKKMDALQEAETIVASLPDGLTDAEKAVELYRVASEEIVYDNEAYGEMTDVAAYLYDGLVGKKTNCDGKANALSLLYNVAGIPCVEKMYRPAEEIGHTWNFFSLDGKWYNADATASGDSNPSTPHMNGGLFFGFADLLATHKAEYAAVYPTVSEGLYTRVDGVLLSGKDYAFYKSALPALNLHHREWCLVLFSEFDEKDVTEQLQDIVDYYRCSARYFSYTVADGRTAFLAILEE